MKSLRISTFHSNCPPSRPRSGRISENKGGQIESDLWSHFGTRFWTKTPLENDKNPIFFAPAALVFFSFTFRNRQNRIRKYQNFHPPEAFFVRNTLRNHRKLKILGRRRRPGPKPSEITEIKDFQDLRSRAPKTRGGGQMSSMLRSDTVYREYVGNTAMTFSCVADHEVWR